MNEQAGLPFGGGLDKLLVPLSDDDLDKVHRQAVRILTEVGIEVHDDAMCQRLAAAGQHVDGRGCDGTPTS